ncbi:uncharacterized protein LOC143918132 isoform X2 [Arctopsyche grandis]|uniref:uncharacterized protein LOC143918132 isoform X2 n=1 Tax=Arctopsyche grandis TaxID=121162 RepID=UPI00406D6BDF
MHNRKILIFVCLAISSTTNFVMNILTNVSWYVSLLLLNIYYVNTLDVDGDRERHFSNKHISLHHSINTGHKTIQKDIDIGPGGFTQEKHIVINKHGHNAHGYHQGFSHYDELDHDHSHHNSNQNPPIDDEDAVVFNRNSMDDFDGKPEKKTNLDTPEG